MSSFRGNDLAEDNKSIIGYTGGVSLEYFIKDNISLNANILYEQKGVKNEQTTNLGFGPSMTRTFKEKYQYLQIPIIARYYFGEKKLFFVNGGPFFGYLLQSNSIINGTSTESSGLNKKIDLGFSGGLGLSFDLKNTNTINLELRNNLGLINISDVETINNGELKTNTLNFIVNYSFNW